MIALRYGILAVALVGCAGDDAGAGGGTTEDPDDDDDDDSTSAEDTGDSSTTGVDPGVALCMRWNADRADLSEGTWSGSLNACEPGDISADGRENALRVLNLYRWIAGLPPIITSDERNAKAQACALMMHANGTLSHTPPPDWTCYSDDGSEAAGSSNIAGGPGVMAVDMYMIDDGNATTLGHRRWILSNSIGPTGLGSTDTFSCMWTLGGGNNVGAQWIAWPPPGTFPFDAVTLAFSSLNTTGWSIQSDAIDLSNAQVEITVGNSVLPVSVTVLEQGYGSTFAISIIPMGWTMTAGATYHVNVTGLSQPIEYNVTVVDC